MAIEYNKNQAMFSGAVSVEDAEALMEWLLTTSSPRVDLSACSHMHPANLQVLMAARVIVSAWPTDTGLSSWLASALNY